MLLGALDLGSNSFHLLVARVDRRGRVQKMAGRKAAIRLEQAVAASGRIPPETFTRALEAVGEMLAEARRFEVEDVVVAGTSALREAENGAAFALAAGVRYGVLVEILSGEEEGRLVYDGARSRMRELPAKVGVIDLGGGSVEVAIGDGDACHFVQSLPLGFLRLARVLDVHGALDRPSRDAVVHHVRTTAALTSDEARGLAPQAWLLSGGTARALGGMLGVEPGSAISTRQLALAAERCAGADTLKLIDLGVEPARARGFGLGIVVLATLAEVFGAPAVRVTPGGLREGLLLREIGGGRRTPYARVHLHDAGRLARPSAG